LFVNNNNLTLFDPQNLPKLRLLNTSFNNFEKQKVISRRRIYLLKENNNKNVIDVKNI